MKVTITQLSDDENRFRSDWEGLVEHTHEHAPDLVLLPELPFCTWIASKDHVDHTLKKHSMEAHDYWETRLKDLKAPMVVFSRPTVSNGLFHNTTMLWDNTTGQHKVHSKYFFPEEEHFWEETWYDREPKSFELLSINGLNIGVLMCTEVWFTEHARAYGELGIDLLLCPRATGVSSVPQWIRCGQTLAVISGAYCLSSNKSGPGDNGFEWGGQGWLAAPMTGELLAQTSEEMPFATVNIDMTATQRAKKEYPLYVRS